MLDDIAASATLKDGARDQITQFVVATLVARLRVEDWHARHPEIGRQPVERPLFILGMPRAGTTLLFNMLCLDPRRRVFWHWEGNREIPPVERARLHDDPRIALRVAEVEAMLDSGALPRNHHVELGDEPTECIWTLGQDFKAYPWLVQTHVPNYFEWLVHEADMVEAYRYHRRVLQVLQSQAPGWWTLKLPSHALVVEAILKVYPDARFVFTHRDPIKPVGSSCSLVDQIMAQQNRTVDRVAIGYQTAKLVALSAERMLKARDNHADVPFLDLHYTAFVSDPMAAIHRLYAFIERDLPPDIAHRMERALIEHEAVRNTHGAHRYRLEDYGLSRAALEPMFADYVERYQIERERD
ncbi:sulfotransferase family protein [Sphingomonas sp. DBB INV C78]|uniref:sulfotransferase family protein n=1 Tax=Sphingomonas sp. DBB INV C78 TaxID=3349434 RepID=UPI0036D20EB3